MGAMLWRFIASNPALDSVTFSFNTSVPFVPAIEASKFVDHRLPRRGLQERRFNVRLHVSSRGSPQLYGVPSITLIEVPHRMRVETTWERRTLGKSSEQLTWASSDNSPAQLYMLLCPCHDTARVTAGLHYNLGTNTPDIYTKM